MNDGKIINGKEVASQIREKVKLIGSDFISKTGHTPGLCVVLVGENPASNVYVRNKIRQTEEVGFKSIEHRLPSDTEEKKLLDLIERLNNDRSINGILVQLPLPKHIDSDKVLDKIVPEKDVDGFHANNVGKLWTNISTLVPCTPLGCSIILKKIQSDLSGMHAVIIGRSNIVGKPMAALLLQMNATVTVVHSRTKNISEICKDADILVAAVGVPEMVKNSWIKEGCIVIDVGINRIKDGEKTRLVGDVDFDDVLEKSSMITPVPGGVGPMTIACLLVNTLSAAHAQHGLNVPSLSSLLD
ncbi:MAG: bifunctional methylenetetrahydrofolate dehydrogenase/methenyltetrahydrofolate cyclohydrolase FolD [Rickettsiales bacterium]|nr:bifunctional methylenetetrahydrofolate dehydrogenase/methenyltetrahydrofolate cyclohydrolase FolD [Rickettsiales bacterium]OUV54919.1 MAG: bifunctional methylenetetrahydrofolate dehydrogenase/methenyltetrahydrofolate cyclohydrolase [Rickettsiales bacterium TMED127]|tara:strand:- start:14451 stop:15350 length:900 start_codon:yes stop_codon:yes gene_type:complete